MTKLEAAQQALQNGDFQQAVSLLAQPSENDQVNGDWFGMLGYALQELNRPKEAIDAYLKAISVLGPNADLHYNIGKLHTDLGHEVEAIHHYQQAIALNPQDAEALNNLGLLYSSSRDLNSARQCFESALAITPNDLDLVGNYANLLLEIGETQTAITLLENAYRAAPGHLTIAQNLAGALLGQGNTLQAGRIYDSILQAAPNNVEALNGKAAIAVKEEDWPAAKAMVERALALAPTHLGARANLGIVLRETGMVEEALPFYESTVKTQPHNAEAWYNLANALADTRRYRDAIPAFRRALELNPNHINAHLNLGIALLTLGEFKEGWQEYEYRWQVPHHSAKRHQDLPTWNPAIAPANIKLLVYAEQGYGDTIQFARYLSLLRPFAQELIFEVPVRLKSVMERALPWCTIITQVQSRPAADFQIPLLSLPMALSDITNAIPPNTLQLTPTPLKAAQWQAWANQHPGLKVGIAWAGNPAHKNDRNRSMPLRDMAKLAGGNWQLVALLPEKTPQDEQLIAEMGILAPPIDRADFEDLTALLGHIDLVISVDTAIAHFAGTSDRPLWLTLPYAGEWRWFTDRNDSPWYPSAKIYRQPTRRDWAGLMTEVRRDLLEWANQHAHTKG